MRCESFVRILPNITNASEDPSTMVQSANPDKKFLVKYLPSLQKRTNKHLLPHTLLCVAPTPLDTPVRWAKLV